MKHISNWQFFALSFFLFSMFLGAGNIIFAPPLGQAAGTHTWIAMSGFLISGVGLVLAAIVALSLAGGSIENLASRVSPRFAKWFSITLFLTLGPIYVIPRTATVVHEVSIAPFTTSFEAFKPMILFIFSAVFMLSTVYLSLEPKKFVGRIGKVLTPTLLVLLCIIVVKAIITPIGSFGAPTGDYVDHAFGKGFTQGYYTMDVLAAFVFGKIFLDAARYAGIKSENMTSFFIKSGLFAICALGLVQISLAGIGASSVSQLGISRNGAEALPLMVYLLLGDAGKVILACTVFLTGWTTAIACLASVSEYFSRIFPKLNYRAWVILLGLLSLIITNFGLNTVLTMASPVLYFLYSISITLIILVLFNRLFSGKKTVDVGAIIAASIMGLFDALKDIDMLPQNVQQYLNDLIPFYSSGMGWLLIAILGGVLGYVGSILSKQAESFQNTLLE